MAKGDGVREARVGELVRAELGRALSTTMADPRLQNAVVTRVQVSPDLQVARVYVRTTGDADEEMRKQTLKGLRAAAARLRRMVADAVSLRRAPELRFEFDEGIDAQTRIDELLREIKSDR